MKKIIFAFLFLMVANSFADVSATATVSETVTTSAPAVVSATVPAKKTPLHFAVVGNELQMKTPTIKYKLDKSSKDNSLTVGNLVFDNNSISANLENKALTLKWNTQFASSGTVTMSNPQGETLWTDKANSEGQINVAGFSESQASHLAGKNKLKFCVRADVEGGYSSLCSQWYQVAVKDAEISLTALTKKSSSARITFQNKPQSAKGSVEVPYGTTANFLATLNTDATYIFVSEPVEPEIKDMIVSEKSDTLSILVGDLQTEVSRKSPEIHVSGKSGGVFTYPLTIKDPPGPDDRHFATEKTVPETYLAHDKVSVVDINNNVKTIEFDLPEKNTYNKVSLDIPGKELTHKTYIEVYRGAAREADFRLTGLSGDDTVLLAEGNFMWWFNDMFGSQNYRFSKLRWGASLKYFTSLSDLKVTDGSTTQEVDLKSMQLDVRYRFTPGLWLKTATWGLIGSYESIDIGDASAPNLGLGGFWVRPMPMFIDKYLNKISYLNNPKWINIEYTQYITSLDSGVDLGSSYSLNVHGKIQFAKKYIGEAGFGAKKYYFTENSTSTGASLSMLYATIGLGITF